MSKYIYFTPEEKARAQNTDLVSLLRAQGERPVRSGREFRTPNDPSITSAKLAAQIPGSVLVNSLEEAADWVKQNAREGDLVITLGCGDIYKASKMMVKKD